jgi:acyl carrier protein
MEDIRASIRAFILEHFMSGEDPGKLTDDTSLERAHVVDSAGVLEIMLYIEEKYGFEVEADDALPENFDTMRNIAAYIERKLASQ